MSLLYFLPIDSIEVHVKKIGGADTVISSTDVFATNYLKYIAPLESGAVDSDLNSDITLTPYLHGLTTVQVGYVGSNPIMLTIENDTLVAYFLDYFVSAGLGDKQINPDIVNDGNNRIHQINGGTVEGVGDTWSTTADDGTVKDADGDDVLVNGPLAPYMPAPKRYPSPLVLFRRKDMA